MPRTYTYEIISPAADWHRTVAFSCTLRTGKIHLHLSASEGGKNPCRRHLYWAEIQRTEEEKRETTASKSDPVSISQHPNTCSNDHLFCSSYLGLGLCWNHQGGRVSACALASTGASAAGIDRSHRWSSIVYVNCIGWSHIFFVDI